MSEKIVDLNNQYHELQGKHNAFETRVDEMAADKDNLLSIQDELRTELQDKMALLDEFEDKFNRQYRCVMRASRVHPRPIAVVGAGMHVRVLKLCRKCFVHSHPPWNAHIMDVPPMHD